MKPLFSLFLSLLFYSQAFPQQGFELEGGIITTNNASTQVYALSLAGHYRFNELLSAGIGLNLWNSGYSDSWKETSADGETATLFKLYDNQTVPGIETNIRIQKTLFSLNNKTFDIYVEPGLHFIPLTRRTVYLNETYLTLEPGSTIEDPVFQKRLINPSYQGVTKSDSHVAIGLGLNGGFVVELSDNLDLHLTLGYNWLDLFKEVRSMTVTGHENNTTYDLKPYFNEENLFLFEMAFNYHFYFK
jgi:hypothetical protein